MNFSQKLNIINVIENIDERYGGPAQVIPLLGKYLQMLGTNVSIHSVMKYENEANSIITNNDIRWHNHKNSITDTLRYSPSLKRELIKVAQTGPSVLHTHNQWNYPSICAYQVHKKLKTPLICSIHGSLNPWALDQYKYIKKVFWFLFQKRILQNANCIHVTEKREFEAVRKLGISTPICLIPNGIDLEEFKTIPSKMSAQSYFKIPLDRKYILYCARIHQSKGLDFLVRAWLKLADQKPDWDLLVVGPVNDIKYTEEIKAQIYQKGLSHRVHFAGMVPTEERLNAFAAADIFVSPTHSENFGISIAEAMTAELPVITTTGAPWPQITDVNCGWWVELNDSNIYNSLKSSLSLSNHQRCEMGRRGKQLIHENYSWHLQAQKMIEVYTWLLGQGPCPECVIS